MVESAISRSEEILTVAQDFIQTRGYNGFSYRDIAAAIGIKSASIHYHFPTKGDLGRSVTARYCDRFGQALQGILDNETTARTQLEAYAALFRDTLVERNRLCMCCILAGELETVPKEVKVEISRFFEQQQQWLAQVLLSGIANGEVQFPEEQFAKAQTTETATNAVAENWATTFVAALEGAMLVSRGLDDNAHFDAVTQNLLAMLFSGNE